MVLLSVLPSFGSMLMMGWVMSLGVLGVGAWGRLFKFTAVVMAMSRINMMIGFFFIFFIYVCFFEE